MRRLLLLLCVLLLPQFLLAQAYPAETANAIAAVENNLAGRVRIIGRPGGNILERMRHYKVKGASIAVVRNYRIAWAKGYGWADEGERRPVTPETLFEPGSISKSLNAVGVLKLVEDKRLDLRTDINTYLKSWKFPYDSVARGKTITLEQLLSHSAGLTVHGFGGYDLEAPLPSLPQILDGLAPANSPPVRSFAEPGSVSRYSGGGTTISQLIVQDVTGRPYDAFLFKQVLKPLGMRSSSFTQPLSNDRRQLCASGYHGDGSPVRNRFHVYPEQAAAGLWTTPSDLCRFIIAMQRAYQGASAGVLSPAMTRRMLTPVNDPSTALGVFIRKRGKTSYFEHGAGNDGFCGQYIASVDGGEGVVVLLNSDNPGLLSEIVNSVAQVYQWPDYYEPVVKREVSVPEQTLTTSPGVYLYDDTWARIHKKGGEYYLESDGVSSQLHFSGRDSFFNVEFSSEKVFVRDAGGAITGYKRRAGDRELPAARKVTLVDSLKLGAEQLNQIGWYFLESNMPAEAVPYLRRGAALYPGNLLILGNLAHSYLFTDNYAEAVRIYKAHLSEKVTENLSWREMMRLDFSAFKRAGYDIGPMSRVLVETGVSRPEEF